jgi:hypothetical protein
MEIIDLFIYDNKNSSYQKELQFELLVLFVLILFFFTYFFRYTYGFVVILLIFTIFILNEWARIRLNTTTDLNKLTLYKLQRIQYNVNKSIDNIMTNKLKLTKRAIMSGKNGISPKQLQQIYEKNKLDSLYIDAKMIHFIDSISPLSEYNMDEYFLFVKGVNNILKIRNQIEEYYNANKTLPVNTSEMFQIALQLRTNTINNIHNFIYSVPKTNVMYKYVDDIIERYTILITRNTDIIHYYYKLNIQQRGINNSTKYVSYQVTKPYDAISNHSIIPVKSNNINAKLIPFY